MKLCFSFCFIVKYLNLRILPDRSDIISGSIFSDKMKRNSQCQIKPLLHAKNNLLRFGILMS